MKYNILKVILVATVAFTVASCHTHKKQAEPKKTVRPQPRQRNY